MYKMTRLLVSRKISIHLFPVIVSVSLLIYLAVEYIKLFQYLERTPHQPYLVFMRFLYSGRTENPGKKPSEQGENQQQSPGHIGGRRVLSPLLHPCSPERALLWISSRFVENFVSSLYLFACRLEFWKATRFKWCVSKCTTWWKNWGLLKKYERMKRRPLNRRFVHCCVLSLTDSSILGIGLELAWNWGYYEESF